MDRIIVLSLIIMLVGAVIGSGCIGSKSEGTSLTTPTFHPILKEASLKIYQNRTVVITGYIENYTGTFTIYGTLDSGKKIPLKVTSKQMTGTGEKFTAIGTLPFTPEQNYTGGFEIHIGIPNLPYELKKTFRISVSKIELKVATSVIVPSNIQLDYTSTQPIKVTVTVKPNMDAIVTVGDIDLYPKGKLNLYGYSLVTSRTPAEYKVFIKANETKTFTFYVSLDANRIFKLGAGKYIFEADVISVSTKYKSLSNVSRPTKEVTITPVYPSVDFEAIKGASIVNSWFIKNYGVAVYQVHFPTGMAKEVTVQLNYTLNGKNVPVYAVDRAVPVSKINSLLQNAEFSNSKTLTYTEDNTTITLIAKVGKIDYADLVLSHPTIGIKVISAVNLGGEKEEPSEPVVFQIPATINSVIEGNATEFNLSGVKLEKVNATVGIIGDDFIGAVEEYHFYLTYPLLTNGNYTVMVEVNGENKTVVSIVPLSLTGVISAMESKDTTNTIYLTINSTRNLYNLYVYVLDKDRETNGKLKVTLSTKGSNGQARVITLDFPSLPVSNFTYYGYSQPVKEFVEKAGGYVVTPFDDAYLSWYVGANYLFTFGVPTFSLTNYVSFPVVFLTTEKGDYTITVNGVGNTSSVVAKPLARIGSSVYAYYGILRMPSIAGLWPINVIVKSGNRVITSEVTYFDLAKATMVQNDFNLYTTAPDYSLTQRFASAYFLDSFLANVEQNSLIERFINSSKVNTSLKNTGNYVFVSNGTLIGMKGSQPTYGMELGYFVFNFTSENGTPVAVAHFEKSFNDINSYTEFFKTIRDNFDVEKLFGVNLLMNPSYLSYVSLNPGDEYRLINIAYLLGSYRIYPGKPTIDPIKLVSVTPVPNYNDGSLTVSYFVQNPTPYRVEVTLEDGKTEYVEPFASKSFSEPVKSISVNGETRAFYQNGNERVYLVVPDKKNYVVGGYEFVNTRQKFPFYELKFIVSPELINGGKFAVKFSGAKSFTLDTANSTYGYVTVVEGKNTNGVLQNLFVFQREQKALVVLKPYEKYVLIDLYVPTDWFGDRATITLDIGGKSFDFSVSLSEAKYLSFLNLFDVAKMPDFGFYTFTWLQPAG